MRSTGKSNMLKLLSAFLILSATSGCVTASTVPVSSYCTIAVPIRYDSTYDTPETVEQVETHNSTWACVCDADCPASAPSTR